MLTKHSPPFLDKKKVSDGGNSPSNLGSLGVWGLDLLL
ncbi:hypothetical protein M670_03417 [Schinkia azotoformans MEV2011]|uniref:Uncharacterized protein n=1 Tax=Schinkia azotoformans MEV2011 TaxID=1348973 RepID=A0A072NVV5_SCHAZ|nr:hypothetical protein M670_03417 [Schinkia azotoformans MEV2011]